MRFQKCPFSSRRKQSKIFSSTLRFSYRFHLSTLLKTLENDETTGTWDCASVNITSAILDRCFFVNVFKTLRFHLSTLERSVFKRMRFQKSPLLRPFMKVSVFIGVSGLFSVDDRQKRIKKYAFSNENALAWMEP